MPRMADMERNMEKNTGIKSIFNKIDAKITNPVRLILGIAFLVIAAAVDAFNNFADSANSIVLFITTAALLSFVNVIFVKAFKIRLNYVFFMIANFAGIVAFLYVISKYNVVGSLYTVLFCVLVFMAMWIIEMCLFDSSSIGKRILGSLLVNAVVVLAIGVAAVLVVTVSFILKH